VDLGIPNTIAGQDPRAYANVLRMAAYNAAFENKNPGGRRADLQMRAGFLAKVFGRDIAREASSGSYMANQQIDIKVDAEGRGVWDPRSHPPKGRLSFSAMYPIAYDTQHLACARVTFNNDGSVHGFVTGQACTDLRNSEAKT